VEIKRKIEVNMMIINGITAKELLKPFNPYEYKTKMVFHSR
jgi:hypothetical protein